MNPQDADVIVIGGGFYGACIALFLRSIADRVIILEAGDDLLTRASFVNQARIHTGFHYPRNFATARRSLTHYERFAQDFPSAVVNDFQMLYAIARSGSKVTAKRFETMFTDMGAPIESAGKAERALFSNALIEEVYRCREFAFDAIALRKILSHRLAQAGVEIRTRNKVVNIERTARCIGLADGSTLRAPVIFDATYGQLNGEGILPLRPQLKYELAEIALIKPPEALEGLGVTVMDGPFFSTMPFPARGDNYSLTHVRYTPHKAWLSSQSKWQATTIDQPSHWLHMARDAARYLPCMSDLTWKGSMFEVKSVLLRNEGDDGRPILFESFPDAPGIYAILGGKLDNIYDLFDSLKAHGGIFAVAHSGYLTPEKVAI